MKYIRPFILFERYYDHIETEIQRIFNELIYKKLAAIMGMNSEIVNVAESLLAAIREGAIWYDVDRFFGKFSAITSRELRALGATYNIPSRAWLLPRAKVPADVRIAQAEADDRIEAIRKSLITTLDDINLDQPDLFDQTKKKYDTTLGLMNKDFQHAVSAITIAPVLTDAQRDIISREWGQNLNLYIKSWVGENIIKLRDQVQQHAFAGGRAQALEKIIIEDYGSSQAKAKFLARQETSLLMSKFRESRYADIGITKYRWSTSRDERVRHDHKLLDGKVFSFSQPPVTDRRTGARNNPGEDFICRCVAIAYLE